MINYTQNILLQVQMVGPEGHKLIWIFLIIALILIAVLLFRKSKNISLSSFSAPIKVGIDKNKIYHPTIITLNILNNSNKLISIQHPVIRFKKGKNTKAYKIKAVNSNSIYPLNLEAGKTHSLPVVLLPFFEFNENLKGFSRVRIEFSYNNNQKKNTKYVLLKPTLFRKA